MRNRERHAPSYRNRLRLFQHGPRPRVDIRAVGLGVLRADIEDRPRPRGFVGDALSVARFDLEGAFAAVHDVVVLFADERWRLNVHEERSQ